MQLSRKSILSVFGSVLIITLSILMTDNALAESLFSFTDGSAAPASGGMADSLLAGTAIGALFGHPYTGLGIADMAVAAVILFLVLKVILYFGLSSRPTDKYTIDEGNVPDDDDPKKAVKMQAASAWARLRSIEDPQTAPEGSGVQPASGALPQGFDREDFLDGAKLLFVRLQKSWAQRQLGQLESFITEDMLSVLTEYAADHPAPVEVEVLLVTPALIEAQEVAGELRAKVLFTALIHEEDSEQPVEVKEIWHFVYDASQQTTWQLDGIEPVANNG